MFSRGEVPEEVKQTGRGATSIPSHTLPHPSLPTYTSWQCSAIFMGAKIIAFYHVFASVNAILKYIFLLLFAYVMTFFMKESAKKNAGPKQGHRSNGTVVLSDTT